MSMKLWELKPGKGATKDKKRIGRGGKRGTTAGKGSKGQNARSGGSKAPGFEGGQTPWYRRLPKFRGFKALNPKEFQVVNLEKLVHFTSGEEVNPQTLYEKGLIKHIDQPVKLLGDGELVLKLKVKVHGISKRAKEQVEAAGGEVEVLK